MRAFRARFPKDPFYKCILKHIVSGGVLEYQRLVAENTLQSSAAESGDLNRPSGERNKRNWIMFMICNEHGARLGQTLPHWLTDYEIIGLADGSNSDRCEYATLARSLARCLAGVFARAGLKWKNGTTSETLPHEIRPVIVSIRADRRVDRWPADASDNPRVSALARFHAGDGTRKLRGESCAPQIPRWGGSNCESCLVYWLEKSPETRLRALAPARAERRGETAWEMMREIINPELMRARNVPPVAASWDFSGWKKGRKKKRRAYH